MTGVKKILVDQLGVKVCSAHYKNSFYNERRKKDSSKIRPKLEVEPDSHGCLATSEVIIIL